MDVMKMKQPRNILTEKEIELVSLLMRDCQSTGDIQPELKRLFAGTVGQMLEAEMDNHSVCIVKDCFCVG
jgi:putative transposase